MSSIDSIFFDAEDHIAVVAGIPKPAAHPLFVTRITNIAPKRDHNRGASLAQMVGNSGEDALDDHFAQCRRRRETPWRRRSMAPREDARRSCRTDGPAAGS